MVICGIYLYSTFGHMTEILMCYISAVGEKAKEPAISCKVETWYDDI
jgi:hypothetical protein